MLLSDIFQNLMTALCPEPSLQFFIMLLFYQFMKQDLEEFSSYFRKHLSGKKVFLRFFESLCLVQFLNNKASSYFIILFYFIIMLFGSEMQLIFVNIVF